MAAAGNAGWGVGHRRSVGTRPTTPPRGGRSDTLLAVRRTRLVPVALAGLALLVSGCGQSDSRDDVSFTGTQKQVADAIDSFSKAAKDEEPTRICRGMLAEALQSADCKAKVQQAIDDTDQFAIDVRAVNVKGDTATAKVITGTGDAERTTTMTLVKEGTSWRISQFE